MCLDYFSGINPGICKTKKMSVFKAEYQSPSTSMFPKDLIQHRHISTQTYFSAFGCSLVVVFVYVRACVHVSVSMLFVFTVFDIFLPTP